MNNPAEYVIETDRFGNLRKDREGNITHVFQEGPLAIRDSVDGNIVVLKHDDAIALAKDILVFHKVPFCNKVSNGQ